MSVLIKDLYNLDQTLHQKLFSGCKYPWEVLPKIETYIKENLKGVNEGTVMPTAYVGDKVDIGEGTIVEPGAVIFGPTIIGKNCTIRAGAYIRGNVILEDNVNVGHSTEVKNSLIMAGATASHFNYVGDSVMGNKSHLATGSILANLKMTSGEVVVKDGNESFATGLRKFGSAIGDEAEVGCNAVLNPGSVIGKRSLIYALISWRGVLKESHIAKSSDTVVPLKK